MFGVALLGVIRRIEVVGDCGVNALHVVFVPTSAGSVPYLTGHVTVGVTQTGTRTLKSGTTPVLRGEISAETKL
jgi:hypothetical protein